MDHVDAGLEVSVGREVLVVRGRSDVVGERQTVEVVLEVDVEETLVGTIEGNAPLGHGDHGVVIAGVGRNRHDTSVEDVWPTNIGGSRKGVREIEELVRSPVGNDVGIDVDNSRELRLLPQVDLGKGRVQISTVHEVQVGGLVIADSSNRQDIIVNSLIARAKEERKRKLAKCPPMYNIQTHILTRKRTLSWTTASAVTPSRVTRTASFLVVPASRSE